MVIKMRLGKTNLEVNKNGFGALPIQRRNMDDSVEILLHAYENGIDFYDTAHFYTDSEAKLGKAFEDVRENIYLASKGAAEEVDEFWKQLETSLKSMKTDYLDLYQFHNISFCPKGDDDLYKAMLEAKEEGLIKHIGITTHKDQHIISFYDDDANDYMSGDIPINEFREAESNGWGINNKFKSILCIHESI